MKNSTKVITLVVIIILIIGGMLAYYKVGQAPIDGSNTTSLNSIKGCYIAKLNKDIYSLNIQSENNGNVAGTLSYNNFEKDSSSGSINGTFTNDTLVGNYSFDSEGSHSDRQVIFKKVGDNFVEGFGPVKVISGKEVFDPITSVTYDPKSTFVKSENCAVAFKDSNNIFSFDYNPSFKALELKNAPSTDWRVNTTQPGVLLSKVTVPKSFMPGTNFSEATFTVGRSSDANALSTCSTVATNGEVKGGEKTIDGKDFTTFTLGDAGAGNFYDTTSYRGIVDGDCYAIEYTIHSTNLGNYSPDQGIKEFDKAKIQNTLEAIISSFQFQIQSS